MPDIKEMILSEEYADIILSAFPCFLKQYQEQGAQLFNDFYGMIHYPITSEIFLDTISGGFFYYTIPKLYTLLDTVSLDASGITAVQNQPVLNLIGGGIDNGHIASRGPEPPGRLNPGQTGHKDIEKNKLVELRLTAGVQQLLPAGK